MQQCIAINRYKFTYSLVDASVEHAIPLRVNNVSDDQEVRQAIRTRIVDDHWFLYPRFAKYRVRERFQLSLPGLPDVAVFNLSSLRLTRDELTDMASALRRLHNSMRVPEYWNVRGIIIHAEDRMNGNSGELMRGHALKYIGYMTLFPCTFAPGAYRDTFACSWLCGTVLHEATHLSVEEMLQPVWQERSTDLGWRQAHRIDARILLPGGNPAYAYNVRPDTCPTPYAALDINEDAVESVTAFAYAPHLLDPLRSMLVETVLRAPEDPVRPCVTIREFDPVPGPKQRYVFHIRQSTKDEYFQPLSGPSGHDTSHERAIYRIPDDLRLLIERYEQS